MIEIDIQVTVYDRSLENPYRVRGGSIANVKVPEEAVYTLASKELLETLIAGAMYDMREKLAEESEQEDG